MQRILKAARARPELRRRILAVNRGSLEELPELSPEERERIWRHYSKVKSALVADGSGR